MRCRIVGTGFFGRVRSRTLDHHLVHQAPVEVADEITKPDGTLITHIDRVLTFTANGKTLTSNDHFTRFVDPAQPFLIDIAGHLISVELPGQGPILLEVGHFILDARNPGAPIVEAGQHDTLERDTAAFCAFFAG